MVANALSLFFTYVVALYPDMWCTNYLHEEWQPACEVFFCPRVTLSDPWFIALSPMCLSGCVGSNGCEYVVHVSGLFVFTHISSSTTFYSFRVVATTQFKGRTFACEGVTGVQLTQCDGDNVLRGLEFSPDTPLIVYFAAEIAIIVVLHTLAGLIMHFYKPGGVKHASGGGPESRGKESALTGDMDIVRAKINVEVRAV